MRDAAQTGFNAAEHQRHFGEGFFAALRVDQSRAIWTFAAQTTWGVGIVASNFSIRRVAVNHGVHVARAHAPKKIGFAKRFESLCAIPIRLANQTDSEALLFKGSANNGHAKTGVIYIGIAADNDDVARIPAQHIHLGT